MQGALVGEFSLSGNQLTIGTSKKGQEQSWFFLWNKNRLYVTYKSFDHDRELLEVFAPWLSPKFVTGQEWQRDDHDERLAELFKPDARLQLLAPEVVDVGSYSKKSGSKRLKFLERKRKNIQSDLDRAMTYKDLESFLQGKDHILHDPGTRKLVFGNLKVRFHTEGYHSRRGELFDKIKKLKRGIPIITSRIAEVENEIKVLQSSPQGDQVLSDGDLSITRPVWVDAAALRQSSKTSNKSGSFRVLKSGKGWLIAIGRSAKENDLLRIQWAKKDDLWFHFEDRPGAHLYLKQAKMSDITPDLLAAIASALADSDGSNQADLKLVYTEVKNLRGAKGTQGKVLYKKARFYTAKYAPQWREILSIISEP